MRGKKELFGLTNILNENKSIYRFEKNMARPHLPTYVKMSVMYVVVSKTTHGYHQTDQ